MRDLRLGAVLALWVALGWVVGCNDVEDRVVSADLGGSRIDADTSGGRLDEGVVGDRGVPDAATDAGDAEADQRVVGDAAVEQDPDAGDAAGPDAVPDGGVACETTEQCAADEACGPQGVCQPRCEPGGCGAGHCGTDWRCVEGGCLADAACAPGAWCGPEGACLPGCRLEPDDCPAGQACGPDHVCRSTEGCTAGAPCETGQAGVCARGRIICQGDEGVCAPFEPARADERCDGRDDDCDGATDEDFDVGAACEEGRGACATPGVVACDEAGGSLCVRQADAIVEPTPEACNQIDDDCDGQIDEDFALGADCEIGAGRCVSRGALVCDGEGSARCSAVPREPVDEACNGVDDDCDGAVDEQPGGGPMQAPCYGGPPDSRGVGACQGGVQTCRGGAWSACEGEVLPQVERCNGVDDDCNRLVDDDRGGPLIEACFEGPEGRAGQGRCRSGARRCDAGQWGACLDQVLPAEEICDQVDNDCNGVTDDASEGCACAPGEARDCYSGAPGTAGVGPCRAGRQGCLADGSGWGACEGEAGPAPEVCDRADNDCDGRTDEGVRGLGDPCLTGVGACQAAGVAVCADDGGLRCDGPQIPATNEICNGRDDDCDGATDEAFPIGEACSVGVGACARSGGLACTADGEVACDALIGAAAPETCNGVDDDCDGAIDDGFDLGAACTVGEGQCAREGVRRCGGDGGGVCDAVAGVPSAERCDGLDDDCDGQIDEGFGVGDACAVGVGACLDVGVVQCQPDGRAGCSGAPLPPTAEVCNGIDDDCDGQIDEGLADLGACQTDAPGVCRAGRSTCVDGARACVARAEASDEICNGLDDDCDGAVDEDTGTVACGQGICARDLPACVDGAPVACVAGEGAQDQELCNGLDDDCDGQTDEAAQGDGRACGVGVGECARPGVARCLAGALTCDVAPGEPAAEICNGLDDDCDGLTDEDAVDPDEPCAVGVGACARPGAPVCRAGVVECSGRAGAPFDEICNLVDDDCDGQIDEGLGGVVCGVGQCRRELVACADGEVPPECQPLLGATEEVCDGVDNDCDGAIDENVPEIGALCSVGQGVCRARGVGACEDGAFRCVADQPAPSAEICNNLDDDCDGRTDEQPVDVGGDCTAGRGACEAQGTLRCAGGQLACTAAAGQPTDEICDGVDNNCDGTVDEGLGTQACGVGQCRRDLAACADGAPVACDPLAGATPEQCNGLDDDCDGVIDDAVPGAGEPCTVGLGACAAQGERVCAGGALRCDAVAGVAGAERCNGVDDDCDGQLDEGFGLGAVCDVGLGACQAQGQVACGADGAARCDAQPGVAVAEACDGVDNDCDSQTDEGLGDLGPCDTGAAGVCAAGAVTCRAGAEVCAPTVAAGPEVCDGLDNDCDGQADEALGTLPCGVGACARDLPACADGRPVVCDAFVGAGPERCNGADDDCDGATDEDAQGAGVGCDAGQGACRAVGTVRCEGGVLACDAVATAPRAELCNAVDDDCDGATDEAVADLEPCTAGQGVCQRVGARVCEAGAVRCTAQAGPAGEEICNGLDDDCDGELDEGFGSVVCGEGICRHAVPNCGGGQAQACDPVEGAVAERCNGLDDDCDGVVDEGTPGVGEACAEGVGLCRRDGLTVCQAGQLQCGVQAGAPAAETCNGVDDDCDGQTDEAVPGVGAACESGVGACAVAGVLRCTLGQLGCDAEAGLPGPEVCNGVDDNCDGHTDEGLGTQICGVGVCRRDLPVCADGQPVACDPGAGAVAEACNGADDDCDGVVDEDQGQVICGVGVCQRALDRCVGGQLTQCNPLEGSGPERCNLSDDDCDGATDEGVAPEACAAGIGACRAAGQTQCVGGQTLCQAQPGQPAPEACNGADDDCDGATDEAPLAGVGEPCAVGVGGCFDQADTVCVGGQEICPAVAGAPRPEVCDRVDNDCDGLADEGGADCNQNTIDDACEIELGDALDCNANGVPDACDIAAGTSQDCNDNVVPDECNGDGAGCVPDVTPPLVDLFLQGRVVNPGTTIQVLVRTPEPDESGIAERGLLYDGEPVALDAFGQTFVELVAPGFHTFVGFAVDGAGNRGEDSGEVRVLDPGDSDPPVLDILSPPNGVVVQGEVPFVITATDPNMVLWRVTWGPNGDAEANELARGTDSVEAQQVGVLATAGLAEGRYDLRLTAEDINGRGLTLSGFFLIANCVPDGELCDGRDNDCDGAADEDFAALGEPCTTGQGQCAVDGARACTGDGLGTACDAIAGLPQIELCNGLDDDCDGRFDERWSINQICVVGVGECERQGRVVCTADAADAVCDATAGDPVAELCNGLDEDCDGGIDEGIFGCGVDTPPTVEIVARPEVAESVAEPIEVDVVADDDVAVASLELTLDGQPVALDANNHAQLTFDRPGVYHLRAVARDQANQEDTAELELRVLDPTDFRSPFVDIAEPRPDEVVRAETMVRGEVDDATLVLWRLTYGPVDDPGANLLAEGDQSLAGDIALFDPALMPNGFVTLRLFAIDVNDRFSIAERRFEVARCEPVAEICDGADNDCDDAVDEGLMGCAGDVVPPEVTLFVSAEVVNPGTSVIARVTATDNIRVDRVTLHVYDGLHILDPGGETTVRLDLPGRVEFVGRAYDAAGNVDVAQTSVRVLAPDDADFPEIVIHSPLPGAVLEGPTAVVATLTEANPWQWWLYVGTAADPEQQIVATGFDAVDNDALGVIDPSGLAPGDYVFRVVFEDVNGRSRVVDTPFSVQACVPGAEVCNRADDDCDGQIDEGFADLGQPCAAGVGVCADVGVVACTADGAGTACDAVAGQPGVEACNDGLDDDCDGRSDEGFPLGDACQVGLGECARAGVVRCDAVGGTTCSAVPGEPAADDPCDGLDNDCDGAVDEGCPDAQAPVIALQVDPAQVAVGEPVSIVATAQDDRGVTVWRVTAAGQPLALDAEGRAAWAPPGPGVFEVAAHAEDAAGNVADEVRIVTAVAAAPTAVVVANPTRVARGDDHQTVVRLDASGSFGGDLTFAWSVPDAVVVAGGLDQPVVEITLPGTHEHAWSLRVTNALGADTAVGAVAINGRPLAVVAAPNQVQVGAVVALDATGSTDPDGDDLHYAWRVVEAPEGAAPAFVDAAAPVGEVRLEQGGLYRLELVVGDGLADSDPVQRVVMATSADRTPPDVVVAFGANPTPAGAEVVVQVQAADAGGVAHRALWIDDAPVPLDANGTGRFTPPAEGRYAVRGEALDAAGNRGGAEVGLFAFADAADDGPPAVEITGPDAGQIVTGPFTLSGRVQDTDLTAWMVAVSPRGAGVWQTVLEGTAAVDGDLGEVDVGGLAEGFYDVRLTAFDAHGNGTFDSTYIEIPPGKTFGRMRRVFLDAKVQLAGIPIEIRRVYDSGRKVPGDFGVAWEMDVGAGRYEASNPPHEGWSWNGRCVGIFGPAPAIDETQDHILTILLGDEGYRFYVAVEFRACGGGFQEAVVTVRALPGTDATLEPLGGTLVWVINGTLFEAGSVFNEWDPTRYRLTLPDGREIIYDTDTGVESLTDGDHSLVIDANGVHHDGGASVTLERDAEGRVHTLRLPDDTTRTYTYDGHGDLVETVDFRGGTTFYRYDLAHNLLRIVDPRGNVPLSMEYDAAGRVIAYVDGAGNRVAVDADPAGRQQVVTDRRGGTTIYSYDADGNVTSVLDALGQQTTFTHDAAGNVLTQTDPLGHAVTNTYDAAGNRLTRTDANGEVWRWTYDAGGRVLTEVDPEGNTTQHTYDAAGNTTQTTDPTGAVTQWAYDADGNNTALTDAEGNVTALAYTANGALSEIVDAAGTAFTLTNDGRSNLTRSAHTRQTVDGPQPVVWQYGHDADGELSTVTGPAGETVRFLRDEAGQPIGAVDPAGLSTDLVLDAFGRIRQRTGPGGAVLQVEYDAEGNDTAVTVPGGARLGRTFDALNRLTEVRTPEGGVVTQTFDAAGQVIRRTSALGAAIEYGYDAAGHMTEVRQPGGATTTYQRDRAGRLTGMTDPTGAQWAFTLDAAGRITESTQPGGLTEQRAYDGLGRLTTLTSPGGRTWGYAWSPTGDLTEVTDPAGAITRYGHDGHGSYDQLTDAEGRVSRYLFDALGRLTERRLPLGQVEHMAYDDRGRPVSHLDFAGQARQYEYDDGGRLVRLTLPDGGSVEHTYDASGRRVLTRDARGDTLYAHDARGRVTRWTEPSGDTVSRAYDLDGRVRITDTPAGRTTYTHNARSELTEVVDPAGAVYGITRDLVGRPTAVEMPDGSTLERAYDGTGRVLRITHREADGGLRFEANYTYDAVGRVQRVVEDDGRAADYAYDALDRLVQARITPAVGPVETIDYTYDAVGNVTRRADAGGARDYTVDANDRLLDDGQLTYAWDANGRVIARTGAGVDETWAYDGRGRLARVIRAGALDVTYEYTTDGLLARRVEGADARRFVWDRGHGLPLLAEIRDDADGSLVTRFVYGAGVPLAQVHGDGTVETLTTDHHGTVRAARGAAMARVGYEAYGAPRAAAVSPLGYLGAWTDESTGLVFLRTRWYSPDAQRFITPDGDHGRPDDPRTLNRYTYSLGDPVNRADPNGQFSLASVSVSLTIVGILANIALTAYPSALEFIFNGLGAFSALRFQNQTAVVFPFLSAGATRGVAAAVFGLEALRFNTGIWALYAYFGVGLSFGGGDGASANLNLAAGAVYDTPEPSSYTAWFIAITASGTALVHAMKRKVASLPGAITFGKAFSVFWSPTPTFEDGDGTNRFSHGWSHTAQSWGFGGGMTDQLAGNITISFTYYLKLLELGHQPGDDDWQHLDFGF